jgi:hypothetical protein
MLVDNWLGEASPTDGVCHGGGDGNRSWLTRGLEACEQTWWGEVWQAEPTSLLRRRG